MRLVAARCTACWTGRSPRSWRCSTSGARSTAPTASSPTAARIGSESGSRHPACAGCWSARPGGGGRCPAQAAGSASRSRTGPPTDQAWIESLFGHVKAEWPHLNAIRDPATLRAELALVRERYNGVRLHAGIGYVTPNDEHEGRGPAIRKARQAGLELARLQRLAWHREHRQSEPPEEPGDVG